MSRRDKERGFTLIEILVAFAIAAVLLLPILRSFATGAHSATVTDNYLDATLIAQSTLESYGRDMPLAAGGVLDRQEGAYHVAASVHRYRGKAVAPDIGAGLALYRLIVRVSWHNEARTRSVALETLRLGLAPPAQTP